MVPPFNEGGFTMRAIVIAAMLALAGCATSGTKISEGQMATMEKGKTTYAEVIARLGAPMMATKAGDGTQMAVYSFSKSQIAGATFIPVVGMFAGGMKMDGNVVTFTFDQAGVLKDYTTSTSHIDVRNGG
jgi:outer membrane protein assembly factor BamE (lipoprotein component of BamABCDE complex)